MSHHDHCRLLFEASQEEFYRLEQTKAARVYQFEMLYASLKNCTAPGDGTAETVDKIMRAIGVLDELEAAQRAGYLALVQAHADAVNADVNKSKCYEILTRETL